MIRLKSRRNCPPGGFIFFEPQTGWESTKAVPSSQWDFGLLCQSLRAHRLQNPRFDLPTDLVSIEAEVDLSNAYRVKSIRGAGLYIIEDSAPSVIPPPKTSRPPLSKLGAVAGAGKKYLAGGKLFLDWIGEGGIPVAPELSASRAEICASCPQNKPGDWRRFFTGPVVNAVQQQIEQQAKLKLATPADEKLGTCEACLCVLRLKVHVPLPHIKKTMPASVQKELDPRCWVLSD